MESGTKPDSAPGAARGTVGRGHVILGAAAARRPRPEQLAHVYRITDPSLSELPLDALLGELLDRVTQILGVDTAAILLLDDERKALVARAARGLEEEVRRKVTIPLGVGFAGRIALERAPIFLPDVAQADIFNPILRERGVQSLLGVPLVAEGVLIGVLHVGTLTPRTFTDEDAAILELAAVRMAPAIERARLYGALEREHRAAVALQRSLLPERMPELAGVEVAVRYRPARAEVGGDWYDVIDLGRGRVGIAIGDVVGHGIHAAALMGQLRTALRAYAIEGHRPPDVLELLDRLLQTVRGRGMATAAYAQFDPEAGQMSISSAGHPPPILIPANGEPRVLETNSSAPLGTLAFPTFSATTVELHPGDGLLLYTDGLVEVRGEPLDAGIERLRLLAAGSFSPEELCERAMRELVPDEGTQDDVALVALQNTPIGDSLSVELPAQPAVLAQARHLLRRWLREKRAPGEDIEAIALASGEACANAIEHAYPPGPATFQLEAFAEGDVVTLIVRDSGHWREARGANRGRGLGIMEAVMDRVEVRQSEAGTEVVLQRRMRGGA